MRLLNLCLSLPFTMCQLPLISIVFIVGLSLLFTYAVTMPFSDASRRLHIQGFRADGIQGRGRRALSEMVSPLWLKIMFAMRGRLISKDYQRQPKWLNLHLH